MLHSVEQMRARARRRLPGFVFDFIDGGAGREHAIAGNAAAFAARRLVPRVLRGGAPDARVTLFGRDYAAPFGVAPMGLPALAWPGADLGLARAAAAGGVPVAVSTAASATIEAVAAEAAGIAWFQLYLGGDAAHAARLVDRAEAAGVRVLVLTVDRPVMGWRTRDLTHGVGLQWRLDARAVAALALHPGWTLATARAGRPTAPMADPTPAAPDWAALYRLRARWPHRLLVKGVLHAEDARRAIAAGADGVVVSNHGGGHLESVAAPLNRLPAIRAAVGDDAAVLLDGGIRSGEDIAIALALGADFVLLGRPFLYAVAALGPAAGPARLIAMLKDQFTRALALLGCATPADLTPALVVQPSFEERS